MDNITHTLTGLMMSRAGLDRHAPRAGLLLMLAANVADIDLIYLFDSDASSYLEHHRGITHSFAMAPVMALLPWAFVALLGRKGFPWGKAYLLSLAGTLSHHLLDWTNIYGIRLLEPFSSRWLRLDITSVVDLWIWLVLAVCFLWPLLARLVSAEIGARAGPGSAMARFALAFLLLYNGGRFVLHQRAVALLDGRLHAGENPRRVAALPSMVNPLRWTGLVEIRGGYVVHEIDLRREFDPTRGDIHYQSEPSPAIEAAARTRPFQIFAGFSQFPLWRVSRLPEPEGALQVEANDMRFGLPGEGRFVATCLLAPDGSVVESRYEFERRGVTIRLR